MRTCLVQSEDVESFLKPTRLPQQPLTQMPSASHSDQAMRVDISLFHITSLPVNVYLQSQFLNEGNMNTTKQNYGDLFLGDFGVNCF